MTSRAREQWISILVPPIVSEELFAAANEQLEGDRPDPRCRQPTLRVHGGDGHRGP